MVAHYLWPWAWLSFRSSTSRQIWQVALCPEKIKKSTCLEHLLGVYYMGFLLKCRLKRNKEMKKILLLQHIFLHLAQFQRRPYGPMSAFTEILSETNRFFPSVDGPVPRNALPPAFTPCALPLHGMHQAPGMFCEPVFSKDSVA
jgi:hypothetical protein